MFNGVKQSLAEHHLFVVVNPLVKQVEEIMPLKQSAYMFSLNFRI